MKKVLVVEDNPDNLRLISYVLQRSGYEVLWAENGEVCLEMALKEDLFFIVMDINLPGIDGIETTRRIRESVKGSRIPIIAITSFAMRGDREKILSAGCNGYLEKPIDPITIMEKIHQILKIENNE